ncbi:trypsin-like peptidase domain-containing protein [Streptomyces sp. NPDC088725]|uniref:trypsin-like peptidase domain-containing protein n=1 Tax=Streptomyces sp. NPDC088725 TaxID=3365873 RepID=UPI0037F3EE7B
MDDGKPTGSKAPWWSRPPAGRATPPESAAPGSGVPEPGASESGSGAVAEPEPAAEPAPVPPQNRRRPLHEPDEYGTPPHGGPGPLTPAPPVQRPRPTPAYGVQPPAQTPAHGVTAAQAAFPPPPPVQPPHGRPVPARPESPYDPEPSQSESSQPEPSQPGTSQWPVYDPWAAPDRQQPLTYAGEPLKRRRRTGVAATVALALVTGVIGGAVGAYVERNDGFGSVSLPQSDPDNGGRAPDSVAGIAASALPSVVTLHVSGDSEQGTGTGFVLDRAGHILTNNHVVEPAGSGGEISVTFSGGETARATLVGKDSGYDLAVVKVTGVSGLKPLPLGNSDSVRVGDPVVAIGAPFDLSNTVTSGIISAKDRPITAGGEEGDGSDVSYVDALQTDAPINPGNSGGPLVDTRARVIGINSAIRAADNGSGLAGGQAGSIGLGFAIPINQGKRVAEELINTGKATHPVIGVTLDMEFTGDGARVGTKAADGPAVVPDGPGAKAGIRPGDVITEVNGDRVHSGEELIIKIRAHRPGDSMELTLRRGSREHTLTLSLGSSDAI